MNLEAFKKYSTYKPEKSQNLDVWSYTRVSSKEQFENNNSLRNQTSKAVEFASKSGYNITHSFGGTYESAKGDFTRKEFKLMIDKIRKAKSKPFAIMIFKMSRFSRSGSGGISVVHELVYDLKVHLIETSSGKSTTTPRGKNEILESLVNAERENIERLEITRPGMIAFLKEGNWLGNVPFGYDQFGPRVKDISRIKQKQEIKINEQGKILQQAWKWKVQGMRDFQILKRLEENGLKLTKQKLSAMWRNPFYCGICAHSMLEGEVVRGKWEKMISEQDFFKVEKILANNNSGYKKSKYHPLRPLAGFLRCQSCGGKLTSYEAKSKGLHYYSCQKNCKGSTLNAHSSTRSKNEGLNDIFLRVLKSFVLQKKLEVIFKAVLKETIVEHNQSIFLERQRIEKLILELEERKNKLERKYAFDDLDKELFLKFKDEIDGELTTKREMLAKSLVEISNLDKSIEKCLTVAKNLHKHWGGDDVELSLKIQELVFPEGLVIDVKKRQYLTNRINAIFALMSRVSTEKGCKEKGTNQKNIDSSLVVAGTRLERATFGL